MFAAGIDVQTILLALIVGLLGPGALVLLNSRMQRSAKLEDWARQDLLAERMANVAASVAHTNASIERVSGVVDVVHALTNSGLTEVKKAQLAALVDVRSLLADRVAEGGPEAEALRPRIAINARRILDLSDEIAERVEQQRTFDTKAALTDFP